MKDTRAIVLRWGRACEHSTDDRQPAEHECESEKSLHQPTKKRD
jgi:hypothetical protein